MHLGFNEKVPDVHDDVRDVDIRKEKYLSDSLLDSPHLSELY